MVKRFNLADITRSPFLLIIAHHTQILQAVK